MASFVVMMLIVAHRFLRLDLTSTLWASLRPSTVLTGLLGLTLLWGVARRSVRVRLPVLLVPQWLLWGWALVSKVVVDGTGQVVEFAKGDYTKDIVFASLLGLLACTARRLRVFSWVFIAVLSLISVVTIPQRSGIRECYHYKLTGNLNYEQETDHRPCVAAADCFNVPRSEAHLRDDGWVCERSGDWGLATVQDRIHYVGTLVDPNGLALGLVMAAALALGLLTRPKSDPEVAPLPDAQPESWTNRLSATLLGPERRWLATLLLLVPLGLYAYATVLAASRAGQVALALVLLMFCYMRVGWVGVMLASVLAAPLALLSRRSEAEAAYSTVTRILTYLNGYEAFWDHPLFGVGFANYGRISFLNAHNSFLLAVTETGLLGGSLFLLGVYLCLKLLLAVLYWPGSDTDLADARELLEIKHLARTLLAMLTGVLCCVMFLSLAFDVLWLLPVGLVAGFQLWVSDRLPELQLRVRGWELLLVLLLGALLPTGFLAVVARNW